MTTPPLNFNFSEGFTGRIEVRPHPDHPDGRLITVRPLHDLTLTIEKSPRPEGTPRPAEDQRPHDAVEDLLRRYERLNPHVRELFEDLSRQGFRFYVPEPRSEDSEPSAEYLRAVYRGSQRRLTLYINSQSMSAVSLLAQEAARDLPGTEMLSGCAVFRYNSDIGAAAEWTAALIRWANTGTTGEA